MAGGPGIQYEAPLVLPGSCRRSDNRRVDVPGPEQLIRTGNCLLPSTGDPVSQASGASDRGEEAPVAVGTPVLARWRSEYYPALVLQFSPEKAKYQIQYCDDVLKWMSRNKFVTVSDQAFCSVPVPLRIVSLANE